jgi:hypothetical protein
VFEVRAAWVMGVALPLLETLRRRTDFSTIAFYVDDYIAGGLLLWAAWSVSRGRPNGRAWLIAAWGVLSGGLYGSFFGQLEHSGPDVSGHSNAFVGTVKGVLYAVSIAGLVLSVRRARIAEASP